MGESITFMNFLWAQKLVWVFAPCKRFDILQRCSYNKKIRWNGPEGFPRDCPRHQLNLSANQGACHIKCVAGRKRTQWENYFKNPLPQIAGRKASQQLTVCWRWRVPAIPFRLDGEDRGGGAGGERGLGREEEHLPGGGGSWGGEDWWLLDQSWGSGLSQPFLGTGVPWRRTFLITIFTQQLSQEEGGGQGGEGEGQGGGGEVKTAFNRSSCSGL